MTFSKGKRARSEVEGDDFIDDDIPTTKKSKAIGDSSSSKIGKNVWELSSSKTPRRVEISEFKGNTLINIREFYEKDGKYLPGKKGISLTLDQYKALAHAIPEINAYLDAGDAEDEAGAAPAPKPKQEKLKRKATTPKKKKANFIATSDEEEEADDDEDEDEDDD